MNKIIMFSLIVLSTITLVSATIISYDYTVEKTNIVPVVKSNATSGDLYKISMTCLSNNSKIDIEGYEHYGVDKQEIEQMVLETCGELGASEIEYEFEPFEGEETKLYWMCSGTLNECDWDDVNGNKLKRLECQSEGYDYDGEGSCIEPVVKEPIVEEPIEEVI